jgi:DNA-directed RNA polymerase specialized sigma24 family protein
MDTSHEEEVSIINLIDLNEAIKKLPIKLRTIAALRTAGYTQRECGEILGVTRAAIGFAEKRAYASLANFLGGEDV